MAKTQDKTAGEVVALDKPELLPPPADLEAGAPQRAAAKNRRGQRWTSKAIALAYASARGCTHHAAARYAEVTPKTAWQYSQDPDWPALVRYVREAIRRDDDRAFLEQEAQMIKAGSLQMMRSLIDIMAGRLPGGQVVKNSSSRPLVSAMASVVAAKTFAEVLGIQRARELWAEIEADRVRLAEGLDKRGQKGAAGDEAGGAGGKVRGVIVDATLDT